MFDRTPKVPREVVDFERPGGRNRVTLIVGLFCADGLLVAADSEEGTEYGGKRPTGKLFHVIPGIIPLELPRRSSKWAMVIGTAGNSAIGDLAVRRIFEWATGNENSFMKEYEREISRILRSIHQEHIPNPTDHRAIQLLIGVKDCEARKDSLRLYKTVEEVLWRQEDYVCCGGGAEIGHYFLDRLYDRDLDEEQANRFATFILREAKDAVGGVGKETITYFLPYDFGRHEKPICIECRHSLLAEARIPPLDKIFGANQLGESQRNMRGTMLKRVTLKKIRLKRRKPLRRNTAAGKTVIKQSASQRSMGQQ